jgi:hypothetical protein
MTLKAGGSISVTGGTDQSFTDDGQTVPGGAHYVVPAVDDFNVRPQLTAKYRAPQLGSDRKYGKDKKSLSYVQPMKLEDGTIVFNTLRIEREVHPDMEAADVLSMNSIGAQLLSDTDTADFWAAGSLS